MFIFANILLVALALLPQPRSTRRYFIASALAIPLELLTVGTPTYPYVYLACDGAVILQCFLLCLEAVREYQYRLRLFAIPLIIALILGKMAWLDAHRPLDFNDWLNIARGCFLLWFGAVLGLLAHRLRLRGSCMLLGLLWLAQGMFSLGHVIHLGWDSWRWADWYFQGAVAIVVWTLVGCGLIRAHFNVRRPPHPVHLRHW